MDSPAGSENLNRTGVNDYPGQALVYYPKLNLITGYLIQAIGTDRYKIGRARNVAKRFENLKRQAPFPLELIHSLQVLDSADFERTLRLKYAAERKHGHVPRSEETGLE